VTPARATLFVLVGLLSGAPDRALTAELAVPAPVHPVPRTAITRHKAKVTSLSGGHGTTCAVRDGAVYCWGAPLGIRNLDHSMVAPERVPGLAGVDSISVYSGSACARAGTRVMCWGDNRWGELGDGTTVERRDPVAVKRLSGAIEQVFAGQHHTCAIVDGGARCWGHGSYGQLGDGTKRSPVTAPVQVRGLTGGVTSMALGLFTTCAVINGRVKCWGQNTSGELALDPHPNRTTPVDAGATGDDFIGVRSEGFTTCAFASNRVACWGDRAWSSPDGFGPVSDLAVGSDGGCVIRSGVVACFRWSSDAVAIIALPAPATQITAGGSHACALAGGEVYCWGNRGFGALGDGTPARPMFDPNFVRPHAAPVAWPSDARTP
jgi:alpha-tubulin suppressor-like RCC1 family protein